MVPRNPYARSAAHVSLRLCSPATIPINCRIRRLILYLHHLPVSQNPDLSASAAEVQKPAFLSEYDREQKPIPQIHQKFFLCLLLPLSTLPFKIINYSQPVCSKRIFVPIMIRTQPPTNVALLPILSPNLKPAKPPTIEKIKVTRPISPAAVQISTSKKAKLTPTAKASMLVATANVSISLIL